MSTTPRRDPIDEADPQTWTPGTPSCESTRVAVPYSKAEGSTATGCPGATRLTRLFPQTWAPGTPSREPLYVAIPYSKAERSTGPAHSGATRLTRLTLANLDARETQPRATVRGRSLQQGRKVNYPGTPRRDSIDEAGPRKHGCAGRPAASQLALACPTAMPKRQLPRDTQARLD